MALRLLGPAPIDIHCGGVDLIFPHHENEIAQAEGATGHQFSRFWYHVEHLLMDDGEKMSKSLGNVFTIRDILDQGYRASALRYLLISVHYRKQLRYSWATLQQAEEAVKRLFDCVGRLERVKDGSGSDGWEARLDAARSDFRDKLLADVNVPGALGAVFELLREANARDRRRGADAGPGRGDARVLRRMRQGARRARAATTGRGSAADPAGRARRADGGARAGPAHAATSPRPTASGPNSTRAA